jgi:hypothetical protein
MSVSTTQSTDAWYCEGTRILYDSTHGVQFNLTYYMSEGAVHAVFRGPRNNTDQNGFQAAIVEAGAAYDQNKAALDAELVSRTTAEFPPLDVADMFDQDFNWIRPS